jgi:hypothetical protein
VEGFRHLLDRFEREGPWLMRSGQRFEVGDPAFGFSGLMMLLLGQKVPCPTPIVTTSVEDWQTRVGKFRAVVKRALPQAEALRELRENPELLLRFSRGSGSWCGREEERFSVSKAMKASA